MQRRAANHLKALRQEFDVYLVVIKPHERIKHMPAHLTELCRDVIFIGPEVRRPLLGLGMPMAACLNELIQPSFRRNIPVPSAMKLIADFINDSGANNVFCFRIRMAVLFDALEREGSVKKGWHKVVDYDDIESIALRRELEKRPMKWASSIG
ncbi:hypothetical protein [Marinobacterium aestuariivivens]|uniref:Uncharacterized protein n=1 Tax=Marinobacterium aestuariivivens TaxID=1698799 RepID=A0ABW1ZU16_9GAMM